MVEKKAREEKGERKKVNEEARNRVEVRETKTVGVLSHTLKNTCPRVRGDNTD